MSVDHKAIQTVIAAIAALISIIAALFAWQQVEVSREHNRLSVTPILQVSPYLEGRGGRNGFYLSNDGLGPAMIKSFSVRAGGVVAEGFGPDRWKEIIAQTDANPDCFGGGWPKGETTIRAGDVVPLLVLTKAEGMDWCLLEIVKLAGGAAIDIEIKYESVYREPRVLRTDSRIASKSVDVLYRALMGQGKH